jgi:ATP-dependent DNA helicase PIF1
LTQTQSATSRRARNFAELLRTTNLIFWDEAVMCHKHAFEAVSRTLQDLRGAEDPRKLLPFGGVTVCFCGDFRQILPVVKKDTRGQIVDATLKNASFGVG